MKRFIEELKPGDQVDTLFSVKYKRAVTQYANGWRFAFGGADKTGEIEVSYWGGYDQDKVQQIHDLFKEGDVVSVQGNVGMWRDKKKIDINEDKGGISIADNFHLADFLPISDKNLDELYSHLLGLINKVEHDGLRDLLVAFFKDEKFMADFKRAPGAMYLHHAWVGGLLEHSLAVTLAARETGKNYNIVDMDLLTTGALLHDIGKMKEYEVTTSIKVGEEGLLRGHTIMGEEMVRDKAKKTGLEEKTLMKLCHILLSHHGKHEKTAPVEPKFVEAILVHYADLMDSAASQFERIKKETTTEDFHVYDKNWGQIYLK